MDNNEIKWLVNIREGDKNAFELLFRQYNQPLCSYAMQIIHDPDDAEEMVQDLFVQLWQKRENLEIKTSLKAYLFRSVHNSCLNYIKHQKIKDAYIQQSISEYQEETFNNYNKHDTKELQQAIRHAIEGLPPERKKVFLMVRYEERRYKEVAKALGISVKTVENQMGKAMQFLRKALNEYLSVIILLLINIFSINNR